MLQLRSNKFANTYSNHYYYENSIDRLECGDRNGIRLQNHTYYFRGGSALLHADLPLHMNNISLSRYYFCYDEDAEGREEIITGIKDKLLETFNTITNDQCLFITGYLAGETLQDKDYVYNFIDTDLWKEFKDDSISSLFNKCAEQTSLRESERQARDIKQHIRVFKSKAKHMILMLTDYADCDQESESFLALGLVPIFFEDFKEKFEPEEIEYFKCLVNRSQVKRISNVKPTELFHALESLEKYKALEREIRYQTLFQKIADARIRTVENNVRRYKDSAEQAIRMYDENIKKLEEADILIAKYHEDSGTVIDELKTISKTQGVYDLINYNDSVLQIVLRVPLDYFDTDEAECAIRNIQSNNVKRFITDVFIEQKYKLFIRTDAYYTYSTEDGFRDFTSIDEGYCMDINAMFNPHFQYYHCLGDYKPQLVKAMRSQDLITFTSIAIAAARSMNFKDGAVCSRWFGWLSNVFDNRQEYYLNMKCLEKDGQLYTLGEWLNESQEQQEPIVIEPRDI